MTTSSSTHAQEIIKLIPCWFLLLYKNHTLMYSILFILYPIYHVRVSDLKQHLNKELLYWLNEEQYSAVL